MIPCLHATRLLLVALLGTTATAATAGLAPQVDFEGPPAPPCREVQVQVGATLLVYSLAAAGDLYSTQLALKGNHRAYETNPLGFNGPARSALKVAAVAGSAWGDFELRRRGRRREANFLRAVVLAIHAGLVVNNLDIAFRGGRR